jgi:hypothetical protein
MSDPILYDYIKQAQTGEPEALLRLEEYMRLRDFHARNTGVDTSNQLIVEEAVSDPNGYKVVLKVLGFAALVCVASLCASRVAYESTVLVFGIIGAMFVFLIKSRKERILKEYIEQNTPKPPQDPTKPKRKTKMRVKKTIYEP